MNIQPGTIRVRRGVRTLIGLFLLLPLPLRAEFTVRFRPAGWSEYRFESRPAALWLDKDVYRTDEATAGLFLTAHPDLCGIPGTLRLVALDSGTPVWTEPVTIPAANGLGGDLWLGGLEPGRYRLELAIGEAVSSSEFRVAPAPDLPGVTAGPIVMDPAPAAGTAVYVGLPLPEGAVTSPRQVEVRSMQGERLPVQVDPLSWWSVEGSLRWAALTFPWPGGESVEVVYGREVDRGDEDSGSVAVQADEGWDLITERWTAHVPPTGPFVTSIRRGGEPLAGDMIARFTEAGTGRVYSTKRDDERRVELVVNGPQRAVFRFEGWYVADDGGRRMRNVLWMTVFRADGRIEVSHSWIFTENSPDLVLDSIRLSLDLPELRSFTAGGSPDLRGLPVTDEAVHIVQHHHRAWSALRGADTLAEGERLEGWLTASTDGARVAVAVEDFWQNFPGAFVVDAQGVHVDFWPERGRDTPVEPNDANFLNMGWLHQADHLNFVVPPEWYAYEEWNWYSTRYFIYNSSYANALGTSKTHRCVFLFEAPDEEERLTAEIRRFTEPSASGLEPALMARSGVFGLLGEAGAADRLGLDGVEAMLETMFKEEVKLGWETEDFGQFVFGGRHDHRRGARVWRIYRGWRLMHHGTPRAPWLLFARSGDPFYFAEGVRNSRRNLDHGFVHHTNEEYRSLAAYPHRKVLGGLTDYKGYVPWHSGARIADYNSMTDYLFYYDYYTGMGRGRETALQWYAALRENRGPYGREDGEYGFHSGREQAGTYAAGAALYRETLDRDLIPFLRRGANRLLQCGTETGAFAATQNYAPWLERYWELTGSERARDMLLAVGDAVIELTGQGGSARDNAFNLLAYAYLASGDAKYLEYGLGLLTEERLSVIPDPENPHHGTYIPAVTFGSNFQVRAAQFLAAVARHGGDLTIRWPREKTVLNSVSLEDGTQAARGAFTVEQDQEQIRFVLGDSGTGNGIPGMFTVRDEDGRSVIEETFGDDVVQRHIQWVRLERRLPPGRYHWTYTAARPFHLAVPVTEDQPERYFFADYVEAGTGRGTARMYVPLTPDTGDYEIEVQYAEEDAPAWADRPFGLADEEGRIIELRMAREGPIRVSSADRAGVLLLLYRHERRTPPRISIRGAVAPETWSVSPERAR